jgi:hypothetical protein
MRGDRRSTMASQAHRMSSDHSDLIDFGIDEAIDEKFNRGRLVYGDEAWVGPHPLVCAHDEVLDTLAYLREAEADMTSELFFQLFHQSVDLLRGVRLAIAIQKGEQNG